MDLIKLHKIQCFGELKNPFYFNKETGELVRVNMYKRGNILLKTPKITTVTAKDGGGYLIVWVNGRCVSVHVIVAIEFLNHKPAGYSAVVDHINGNILDNRIENLQLVTNRVNTAKGRLFTNKISGLPLNIGWWEQRNKYYVRFMFNGKTINFGYYLTLEAAILARDDIHTRIVENKESLDGFKSKFVTAKKYS